MKHFGILRTVGMWTDFPQCYQGEIKMTVLELVEKYDFHDSNISMIKLENTELTMLVDVCMWKQKAYMDAEDEICLKTLKFYKVCQFGWKSDKEIIDIEYETIIKFFVNNEHVKIVMDDEGISILEFSSQSVEII